jgi:hypothetical protein
MNPRHLALVFVAAWMGCSTNGAIDAASTPVDAFDAATIDANADASTLDANNDASTTDANNDASTLDADNDASATDADNNASAIDANSLDAGASVEDDAHLSADAARDVGASDAWETVPSDADDDANNSESVPDCGVPLARVPCASVMK